MTISHSYDAAGREILLETRKSNGAALTVYTATYDRTGNRPTMLELDEVRVRGARTRLSRVC
jgi:hypothetical protein